MCSMRKSSLINSWAIIFVFCLSWAELGRLTGHVKRDVLDALVNAKWWDLSSGAHIVALAILILVMFLLCLRRLRGVSIPVNNYERALAVAILLLGFYLCLNQFSELENVMSRKTDFGTIYSASLALFSGEDPYRATGNEYFYPPLLAFLFGPLTRLPLAAASTLFFSFKFIMVVWTLVACYRLVEGYHFRDTRHALFVLGLIFVAARFWVADLQFGNTNVVIMFLVVAAIFQDRNDNHLAAGLFLALAVAIKILPCALCLHFLLLRRWRTIGYFLVGLIGFNLLPWAALPQQWGNAWLAYFDAGVVGKLSQRLAQPDNQSLWGLINRMFPEDPLANLRLVWGGAAILLTSFVVLVSARVRNRADLSPVAGASLFSLLGLLVSPGSWVVHYTAVLLPMVVLWKICLKNNGLGRWPWVLFFCANFAYTLSGWSRPTVNASISQSWFVIVTVLLLVGIGVLALSGRPLDASGGPEPATSDPK